ncbi:MAG: galactose mutarotase [Bacteroidales bacterium]|nr:galactose mutarotase [Bacteroidales bacterium]
MTKSGLDPKRFEAIIDGKRTALYTLTNANGMEVCISNYGGTIVSVMTPDRNGTLANVVLGFDNIETLTHSPEPTFGSTIGRYGNRIARGQFTLAGKTYQVPLSQAPNCLHGGMKGFHFKVWDVIEASANALKIAYTSVDGEEGFPGTLASTVTFTLTDDNAIRIDYSATTDKLTLCNLTNHSYFNLAGLADGKPAPVITDHVLTMCCDNYIPVDATCIPLGHRAKVEGTPFDFRTPHVIGERIEADDEQIRNGAGYDHCFAVNRDNKEHWKDVEDCVLASIAECPATGRVMKTYTTEPGLQLYTANWLSGFAGINGTTFPRRSGFCLEAQHHPDSPNQPEFEQATLAPNETYRQVTVYAFSIDK